MAMKRLTGKALAEALEATAGLTFRDHERLQPRADPCQRALQGCRHRL